MFVEFLAVFLKCVQTSALKTHWLQSWGAVLSSIFVVYIQSVVIPVRFSMCCYKLLCCLSATQNWRGHVDFGQFKIIFTLSSEMLCQY